MNPSTRLVSDRTTVPNWVRIENIAKGIEQTSAVGSTGNLQLGDNWRLVQETTPGGRVVLKLQYIEQGTDPKTVQVFQAS
jgi:hypothetical protein